MRSTAWLMSVFVASCASLPGHAADMFSAAAPLLAQQSPVTAAPPPDLRAFPVAAAPGGLATVRLPDTEAALSALFERLPATVAGRPRVALRPGNSGAVAAGYGNEPRLGNEPNPSLRVQVIDLRKGDFFPTNWTGGQVVGFVAQARTGMDAGRDGDLYWLRDQRPATVPGSPGQVAIYGITWGRIDSPWLFSVQGDTQETRDALLTAVVAAARSASGK